MVNAGNACINHVGFVIWSKHIYEMDFQMTTDTSAPATALSSSDRIAQLEAEVARLKGIITRSGADTLLTLAQSEGAENAVAAGIQGQMTVSRATPFEPKPYIPPVFPTIENANLRAQGLTAETLGAQQLGAWEAQSTTRDGWKTAMQTRWEAVKPPEGVAAIDQHWQALVEAKFSQTAPSVVQDHSSATAKWETRLADTKTQGLITSARALATRLQLTTEETRLMLGLDATTDSAAEKKALAAVFGIETRSPTERFMDTLRAQISDKLTPVETPAPIGLFGSLKPRTLQRLVELDKLNTAMTTADTTHGPINWALALRQPSTVAPFGELIPLDKLMQLSPEQMQQNGYDLEKDNFAARRPLNWLLATGGDVNNGCNALRELAGGITTLSSTAPKCQLPQTAKPAQKMKLVLTLAQRLPALLKSTPN